MNNLITYAQWLAQYSGNESVFHYIKTTSGIDFTAKSYYSKVQQLFELKYLLEYINDTTDNHSRFADLVKIKILENQDAFDKAYSRFTDATIDFFDDITIHELTESGTGSKSFDTTDSGTKTSIVDRDSTKQIDNTKTTKKSDTPMGSTTAIQDGYLTGVEQITETNNETIEDDSTITDSISNTGESTESTEQGREIIEKTYTANPIKDLRLARIGNLIKEIVETFADCFIIID